MESTLDSARDGQASPICIAGMHRSGTSMVAKLLQLGGLYLGEPTQLMPPAEENPEGFFEHLALVDLNQELLNAAGGGWDCPPAASFDWTQTALDPFRERAAVLVAPLQEAVVWGWKDPRNSLTLPFWQSALGPLRTVFVVRNPLEVITSLHRRNGFSVALGLTLWRIYAERVLAASTPEERLITHFDSYFFAPEREIPRLLTFTGLSYDAAKVTDLRTAAVPELRHHRKTLQDLFDYGLPHGAIALYHRLCAEAGWQEGAVPLDDIAEADTAHDAPAIARGLGRVDLLRVENEALRRNNADFTIAMLGREARIAELEMAIGNHEAARAELDGKVAERDSKVRERNALIIQRDHTIAAQQLLLDNQAAELSRLRAQVADLSDRLVGSERREVATRIHERELRAMHTALQELQLQRDAEIMGTLGAVLSRHAPGAPASIYYRRLVAQLRQRVEELLPPQSRLLVATYGDDGLLSLGERLAAPFPRATAGIAADYTDVSDAEAISQIEAAVASGVEYLVVPSPAIPWLAAHPELERHIEGRYPAIARERGICTIYALRREQGEISA